jgi:hypothetical protein
MHIDVSSMAATGSGGTLTIISNGTRLHSIISNNEFKGSWMILQSHASVGNGVELSYFMVFDYLRTLQIDTSSFTDSIATVIGSGTISGGIDVSMVSVANSQHQLSNITISNSIFNNITMATYQATGHICLIGAYHENVDGRFVNLIPIAIAFPFTLVYIAARARGRALGIVRRQITIIWRSQEIGKWASACQMLRRFVLVVVATFSQSPDSVSLFLSLMLHFFTSFCMGYRGRSCYKPCL